MLKTSLALFSHSYSFVLFSPLLLSSSLSLHLLFFFLSRSAFLMCPSCFSLCFSPVTQAAVPAVKRIACFHSVHVCCVCLCAYVCTCVCTNMCINAFVCTSVGCAVWGVKALTRDPCASTSIIPFHLLFPLTLPQNVKGNY